MIEFAILHKTKKTQILITNEFDVLEDKFIIEIKAWDDKNLAFEVATQTWNKDQEDYFLKYWKKFKSKKYCKRFIK